MSKQSTLTVGTLSLISETHRLLDGLSSDHDFEKFIPQTLRGLDVMDCKRIRCRITGDYYRVQLWDGRVFRADTLRAVRRAIVNG